jgi:hypothetical protein
MRRAAAGIQSRSIPGRARREAVVVGHYLRMTHIPKVEIQRGPLAGGGTWERTESTATLANFYDWGVVSEMTYFDVFPHAAVRVGDFDTVSALKSIRTRLARAGRALDEMLAALSNRLDRNRRADVIEAAAEAFDRELLYLAAAFDIYGRRFPLLIDPTRDASKFRFSLDGRGYVNDHLAKEYDATALADVTRLHVYAGCARCCATTSTTASSPSISTLDGNMGTR